MPETDAPRTIKVYAAQPSHRAKNSYSVEALNIQIGPVAFPVAEWKEAAVLFESEAERIEAALHQTLPGGTYDRLLIKMLQRQASLFVVPHSS